MTSTRELAELLIERFPDCFPDIDDIEDDYEERRYYRGLSERMAAGTADPIERIAYEITKAQYGRSVLKNLVEGVGRA